MAKGSIIFKIYPKIGGTKKKRRTYKPDLKRKVTRKPIVYCQVKTFVVFLIENTGLTLFLCYLCIQDVSQPHFGSSKLIKFSFLNSLVLDNSTIYRDNSVELCHSFY